MTSEIQAAIKGLQEAHLLAEQRKSGQAAVQVAKIARDLIDALVLNNTFGPDPNNNPNDSNRSGGGE